MKNHNPAIRQTQFEGSHTGCQCSDFPGAFGNHHGFIGHICVCTLVIRIGFGRYTSLEDIETAAETINAAAKEQGV